MDAIDGQEVLFPVVLPADLWKESGRFTSVGKELLRLTDRLGADLVLGMTHEEAAVHLARDAAKSYAKYPFMIYQIQTKFRDEPRARGGLIRVREFTMKDAYSFHTSLADLEAYYDRCYVAYERIFKRAGCKNVIAVLSDSGMMGGRISHEFMLLTAIGEDTLVLCDNCDFKANIEACASVVDNSALGATEALTLVPTPEMATIEEVAGFLKKPHNATCKAVVYQRNADDSYVVAFVRGDLDVHETKLRNTVGAGFTPRSSRRRAASSPGSSAPWDWIPRRSPCCLTARWKALARWSAARTKSITTTPASIWSATTARFRTWTLPAQSPAASAPSAESPR